MNFFFLKNSYEVIDSVKNWRNFRACEISYTPWNFIIQSQIVDGVWKTWETYWWQKKQSVSKGVWNAKGIRRLACAVDMRSYLNIWNELIILKLFLFI